MDRLSLTVDIEWQSVFRLLATLFLFCPIAPASDAYLFAYFKDPGKSGVFYAISQDGYRWTPVRAGQAITSPDHSGELMRDPHIARGPDGMYHMIWTWEWHTQRMGHATSRDLVSWSPHEEIPAMAGVPGTRNVWAPELYWDKAGSEWLLIWSSTVEGRFPETMSGGEQGNNHRIYSMTTRDFKTFSEPRLFFDPGYEVIDATILEDGAKFYLVFKDERRYPLSKFLLLAEGKTLRGPWSAPGKPFTESWSEGPSILKIAGGYIVYYDHYRDPRGYRAAYSTDLQTWRDVTDRMSFPPDAKHGCFLRLTAAEAAKLLH